MKTFLQALTLATVAIVANSAAIDKHGFTFLGKKVVNGIFAKDYYLSPTAKSHSEGQQDCKKIYGGQLSFLLTSLQDSDLKDFLALPENRFTVHLGGSREASGKPWYWDTGVEAIPFGYTNWRDGQPINANHCTCAGGMGQTYGWQGCVCDTAYRYVCEV